LIYENRGGALNESSLSTTMPEPSKLKTSVQVEAVRIGGLGATSLIASGGG
jgi:hypothetical protein